MHWQPDFAQHHPIFAKLKLFSARWQDFKAWPSLSIYQRWLQEEGVCVTSGKPLQIAPQRQKSRIWCHHYEARIYLNGVIPTRFANWHDFFNLCMWMSFPLTKALLNQRQYKGLLRHKHCYEKRWQRDCEQNSLTQFDECGLIVLTDRSDLLTLLKNHCWEQLFYQHRQAVGERFEFIPVGHALLERSFQPYLGLTAKALLMKVPDVNYFKTANLKEIDEFMRDSITESLMSSSGLKTFPIPISGIPGWSHLPQTQFFYRNKIYFR